MLPLPNALGHVALADTFHWDAIPAARPSLHSGPAPTSPGLWPGLSTGSLCLMSGLEVTLRVGAGSTTLTHPLTRKLPHLSQPASLPTQPLWPLESGPGHQPQLPLQMMTVMAPGEEEDGKPTPSPHPPGYPASAPFPLSAGALPKLQGLRAVLVGS